MHSLHFRFLPPGWVCRYARVRRNNKIGKQVQGGVCNLLLHVDERDELATVTIPLATQSVCCTRLLGPSHQRLLALLFNISCCAIVTTQYFETNSDTNLERGADGRRGQSVARFGMGIFELWA